MPRGLDDAGITRVLDAIYDSAVDPERWPSVLAGLAGLFNSQFADLFARTNDRTRFHGMAYGLDQADYADQFLGTWVRRNVWGKSKPVELAGEVLSTRQMVAKDELLRSEMYNEYLAPRGLHEGLRLAIWSGEGWIQDISLLRPWSAGAFDDNEIALGRTLLPHIQRAAGVTRRLRQASLTAQAGFDALDALRHAAILVDASGRPLQFNRAADRLLADADGMRVAGAEIVAALDVDSTRLRAAIAAAAGLGGRAPQSGSLSLPRPSGKAPLAVIVIPVREAGTWMSLRQPAALLLVGDPQVHAELSAAAMTRRFGLTESEASLALDLLTGRSVAAIAAQRGRSVHTVRTHLARLMGKTGTNRQSDLLRLLMSIRRGDGVQGPLVGEGVVRIE